MELFKEKYLQQCQQYQVDPLQPLLEKLENPSKRTGEKAQSQFVDDNNSAATADNKENDTVISNRHSKSKQSDELDLKGQTLSLKMCKALAETLQTDQVFTRLNFGDTLMGDDGCTVLAQALKANGVAQSLDLRGNNLRSDGAAAIGQMLKVNQSIKSLTLEWNCIGIWETGIGALADAFQVNSCLQELDLRNNKINPQGSAVLASQLKHNTSLKRLDLRWNNIGLLGGRAFLDLLKWNKTILYLELAGNDIPDDVLRAIEMALERNRDVFRSQKESSQRAQFLSSTLQQITFEHEQALQSMREKVVTRDSMAHALEQKLGLASDEVQKSHMGYRVLENRYTEEKTKRESLEKKMQDMEDTLMQERRDHTERCQSMLSDLMKEREHRVRMEEAYRHQISQLQEKQLVQDSSLKESQLKNDLAAREKATLMQELEKYRKEITHLQATMEEQVKQAYQNKRELEAKHRIDLRQQAEDFADKVRSTETERARFEEMAESLKNKATDWDARYKNTEKQIRLEEHAKRQELIGKLQALAQHREALQQSLNAHLQTHRQMIIEYESKLTRLKDNHEGLNSSAAQMKADLDRLRERSAHWDETERSWQIKNDRLDEENRQLRTTLERLRDDEVQRAKELERAVTGYVRSVERSERRVVHDDKAAAAAKLPQSLVL